MGGKVFELMLEIGHKSQPLKSKLPNGYTHKWTIFVRGANNSKIEHCIQRVVFQLHDSFPDPQREITEPPFQVKETGYAGFEIPIEIYFKNRERKNHIVFTLDLCLHNDLPLNSSRIEKVKFHNPHREFEKCLVKSGAELLSVTKDKKVRSDSPPAKKQKSSSLIPSKDMSKQAPQQQSHSSLATNHYSISTPSSTAASQNLHQTNSTIAHANTNHHRHSKSSQQNHTSYNSHASNGISGSGGSHQSSGRNSSSSNFNNHFSHQTNSNHGPHHTTKTSSQQQASSLPKVKSSSKEFIDVFGAPLVCNNNNNKSHKLTTSKDTSDNHRDVTFTSSERSPLPPIAQSKQPSPQLATSQSHNQSHHHKSHHNSNHHNHNHSKHYHTKPQQELPPPPSQKSQAPVQQKAPQKPAPSLAPVANADSFHIIQNKISSLADCDKLQKIVDIIEESGEWFNLTPNKFEFDLKRLDKKTMSKIEKCLQH